MDPVELAELEHENWIGCLTASVTLSPDGLCTRDRDVVTVLGHVPMRFFNQILVDGPNPAASAIAESVSRARERGDSFVVSLRPGVDDRFAPLMAELGLMAEDDAATLAMALHPIPHHARSGPTDAGFEIRRITDRRGIDDHRKTVTDGFGAPPAVAEALIGVGLLQRSESTLYAGYLDGQPVTSGFGWHTGRTIGVYNIATIPSARRRGFGEAMTARVLADGQAAGCDVAVLQASAMGRPIYERLGFRVALRYIGWVDGEEDDRGAQRRA